MEKIIIRAGAGNSEILIGEKWMNVESFLPESDVIIITDENVFSLYGKQFPSFPVLRIKPGEESKNLMIIGELAEKMLQSGIDRSGMILAIGGGVVCDIAGFLASIYMRGIRCGYISTTLLAQVDASTGGKNGVDLGGAKNILGCFSQPEFVICDTSMLSTLSEEEYFSGLAELIKTAIIGDRELFEMLEKHHSDIMDRNPSLMEILVAKAVKFKSAVVTEDEKEKGLRRILNFGHTFGHAIEMHRQVRHGFAVAEGMVLSTRFSKEKELISEKEMFRIIDLIEQYGFTFKNPVPAEAVENLIHHDKKRSGREINFVFASGIGNAVYDKISVEEIMNFYKRNISR
ncbi:MAG TPA: 3-dehydroquinate synthase [Bacteroidales bacterium]|nr:3-dehydroquinate synthase [Bacteroidales bacterium]